MASLQQGPTTTSHSIFRLSNEASWSESLWGTHLDNVSPNRGHHFRAAVTPEYFPLARKPRRTAMHSGYLRAKRQLSYYPNWDGNSYVVTAVIVTLDLGRNGCACFI